MLNIIFVIILTGSELDNFLAVSFSTHHEQFQSHFIFSHSLYRSFVTAYYQHLAIEKIAAAAVVDGIAFNLLFSPATAAIDHSPFCSMLLAMCHATTV